MEQSDELKLAIEAAREAGKIIKENFGKETDFTEKVGKGIVTEIDHQSEDMIVKILQTGSNYPMLAEESGEIGKLG